MDIGNFCVANLMFEVKGTFNYKSNNDDNTIADAKDRVVVLNAYMQHLFQKGFTFECFRATWHLQCQIKLL